MAASDSSTVSSAGSSSKDLKKEKCNGGTAATSKEHIFEANTEDVELSAVDSSSSDDDSVAVAAVEGQLEEYVVTTPTTSVASLQTALEDLIQSSEIARKEHKQEMQRLEAKLLSLTSKLKRKLGMISMATYTQVMKDNGGDEDTLPTPTYVLTYQTQLCRAFHVHEVYLTQIKKMQRRNRKLILHMRHEVSHLQQESTERKLPLSDQVEHTQEQVLEMQETLGIDPSRASTSSLPSLFFEKGAEHHLVKRFTAILPGLGGWRNNNNSNSNNAKEEEGHMDGSQNEWNALLNY